MPSKQQDTITSKRQINPALIATLLDFKAQLKDKIQTAITKSSKLRIEDLMEDNTINLDDEYIED